MRSIVKRFEIRQQRIRTAIRKKSDRPRLSVFKSGRHLYVQLIDDTKGQTLAAASTLEKDIRKPNKSLCNKVLASEIGKIIGQRAVAAGIKAVVFDKGGNKYHGVVKTLADSAREFLDF